MKAIKSLVIFMGVLLVAGIALLGYGMYSKAGRLAKPQAETAVVNAPAGVVSLPSLAAFGDLSLGEPEGSEIKAVSVQGATMVLTVTGGALGDRVVVLDLASGARLGRVVVSGVSGATVSPAGTPAVPAASDDGAPPSPPIAQ